MVTKPSAAGKKAPVKTSAKPSAKAPVKPAAKPPVKNTVKTPVKTSAKPPVKAPSKPVAKAPVAPAPKPVAKHVAKAPAKPAERSSKDPFEKYRSRLLVRQEELILDISRNRQVTDDTVDEQAQDMVDRATSAYTREFAFSLSESDRKALLLIEQALLRIDQGTYGVCVHCQGIVQDKRLEAVPWARHCLECQEMQDKGLL
ncbi:MAG: TraR/DksA C4-type zinc finger protein [Holophagales bacterium]|nr:TraR/DksA C4-type zinc finger protein [Holophagales bacterium]